MTYSIAFRTEAEYRKIESKLLHLGYYCDCSWNEYFLGVYPGQKKYVHIGIDNLFTIFRGSEADRKMNSLEEFLIQKRKDVSTV